MKNKKGIWKEKYQQRKIRYILFRLTDPFQLKFILENKGSNDMKMNTKSWITMLTIYMKIQIDENHTALSTK